MEEQFVPYDLALKLKDLGFNKPCLAYYWNEIFVLSENKNGVTNKGGEFGLPVVVIPLWQQAFDWIRINYGLFYFEDHRVNSKNLNDKTYWFGIKKFKEAPYGSECVVGLIELGCSSTYTEGRLKCFKKLIQLIS